MKIDRISTRPAKGVRHEKVLQRSGRLRGEMMEGLILANPRKLKWIPEYNIVYRADMPRDDKVSVVQGSGSGHEPAHIMFVGQGMLDAACPGKSSPAPPVERPGMHQADELAQGCATHHQQLPGRPHVLGHGGEVAEAEGIRIGTVIVDDDVAVQNRRYTVGRRGVAGNFFVIKACGAAAEQGAGLEQLVALGKKVNSLVRTMGVAITSCTPP